ncbi:MAG: hypothetical protein K8J08_00900 [Thermoanaerobaculia bacterium]|nr:hypothetical protein [Thermoanaerobaculia bacterium]
MSKAAELSSARNHDHFVAVEDPLRRIHRVVGWTTLVTPLGKVAPSFRGSSVLLRRATLWLLVLGSLGMAFGPALGRSLQHAANPLHINDDARQQVWPFLRDFCPGYLVEDYTTDYYLAWFPLGARAAYHTVARAIDPRIFTKVIPYLVFLVVAGFAGRSAYHLGGIGATWGSWAILLSGSALFDRLIGGLPRGFGPMVASMTIYGLVAGRPGVLVAAGLIGAALYPPSAVAAGISLACYLLLLPKSLRGRSAEWSLRRRLTWVAVAGLTMVALVAPVALRTSEFGRFLSLGDAVEYPEAGPGGRYVVSDRADYPLGSALRDVLTRSIEGDPDEAWFTGASERFADAGPFVLGALILLTLIAALAVPDARRAVLRVAMLVPISLGGYLVAAWLTPFLYLPQRHLVYVLPVFCAVIIPGGAALAVSRLAGRPYRWLGAVAVTCLLVGLWGSRGPAETGYSLQVPDLALYRVLDQLPPDSLIAGWPGGLTDFVPYVSGLPVLVSFETHQAFHSEYVEVMRHRMQALIDVHFASDLQPAAVLRDEFGVSHLLIDTRRIGTVPRSMEPFTTEIARRSEGWQGPPEDLVLALARAAIWEEAPYALIDLDRLLGPPTGLSVRRAPSREAPRTQGCGLS